MVESIIRHYNIIGEEHHKYISDMLSSHSRSWVFQKSMPNTDNVFLMSSLDATETKFFLQHFNQYIEKYKADNLNGTFAFERAYINCHHSYHPGDWHIDNESGFTLLYYPETDIDFNNEGGTEIKDHGIEPYIKNSILIFPANRLHQAQGHSINGKLRFSIALKFRKHLTFADKLKGKSYEQES